MLQHIADSICSSVRGCRGVWVEPFRGSARGSPLDWALSRRIAETLARHGEDLSPLRQGPWVAAAESDWPDTLKRQALPCQTGFETDVSATHVLELLESVEAQAHRPLAETLFVPQLGAPRLLRLGAGILTPENTDWLWHILLRGYWPLVAQSNSQQWPKLERAIASVAQFSGVWMTRGRVRAAPEMLVDADTGAAAASDGSSRFYVFFPRGLRQGATLHLPPGYYRYYWVDPMAGNIVDRADGVQGSRHSAIPGSGNPEARMLVLESEDAPDNLTTW